MQLIDPKDPEYLLSNITDPGELKKWKTAAETWRLPYWDFALRRPNNHVNGKDYCCLPDFALKEMFQSSAPEANNQNPWYAYTYPGKQSGLPNMPGMPVSIPLSLFPSPPLLDSYGYLPEPNAYIDEHPNPDCATRTGL